MGDDPDRPRVDDDLALGGLAVVVGELVDVDVDDPALVNGLRIDSLHRRSPYPATAAANARPAASGAAKNSGSSSIVRPMVFAGSPLAA